MIRNLLAVTCEEYNALSEADKAAFWRQKSLWPTGGAFDKPDSYEIGALNEVPNSGEKCS